MLAGNLHCPIYQPTDPPLSITGDKNYVLNNKLRHTKSGMIIRMLVLFKC